MSEQPKITRVPTGKRGASIKKMMHMVIDGRIARAGLPRPLQTVLTLRTGAEMVVETCRAEGETPEAHAERHKRRVQAECARLSASSRPSKKRTEGSCPT